MIPTQKKTEKKGKKLKRPLERVKGERGKGGARDRGREGRVAKTV